MALWTADQDTEMPVVFTAAAVTMGDMKRVRRPGRRSSAIESSHQNRPRIRPTIHSDSRLTSLA